MARRTIPTDRSKDHNKSRDNGVVPKSTLAAQLVYQQTGTDGLAEPSAQAVFVELLQEILNNQDAIETDNDVNFKLLSILAGPALNGLLKEDPFAQVNELIRQAKDSLAVINLTIQRHPKVLFYQKSADHGEFVYQLYLWLLPKILSLIGHRRANSIQEDVDKLLVDVLQVLSVKPYLWHEERLMMTLYQRCIEDVIASLERAGSVSNISGPDFMIALPAEETIADMWPAGVLPIALPHGFQTLVEDPSQAILIAIRLIGIILASTYKDDTSRNFEHGTFRLRGWATDTCSRLTSIVLERNFLLGLTANEDRIYSGLLRILKPITGPDPRNARRAGGPLKVAEVLVSCIEKIFELPNLQMYGGMQQELSLSLRKLLSLSKTNMSVIQLVSKKLKPSISDMSADTFRFSKLAEELQASETLTTWLSMFRTSKKLPEVAPKTSVYVGQDVGTVAPAMPRLEQEAEYDNVCEQSDGLLRYLDLLGLGTPPAPRSAEFLLDRRRDIISDFVQLSDEDRIVSMRFLSTAPCTMSDALPNCVRNLSKNKCSLCDMNSETKSKPSNRYINEEQTVHLSVILGFFAKTQEIQLLAQVRILTIICMQRFAQHVKDPAYLNLTSSSFGQHCLRCLHSSSRELRLAAGRALAAFVRSDLEGALRRGNRMTALGFLRTLSERNEPWLEETLIMAWGQLGSACGTDEINIVLLFLVDYLGHSNPLVTSVAFTELCRLAETSGLTAEEFFRPFWCSVAISVVKDLQTRPQKAQQLADFLSLTVNQLLVLTQRETIPYLVLTRRRDLLQRIAVAHGASTTISTLCLRNVNEALIVAAIFIQNYTDVEKEATQILYDVSPDILKTFENFQTIATHDPVITTCEMLKLAGDEESSRKSRFHDAVRSYAMFFESKVGRTRAATKQGRIVTAFFETNLLGIMDRFCETLDSPIVVYSALEKKRCLRGIEEMINLAKTTVSIALPQIRACLQSACQSEGIRDEAFSVWVTLLRVLEESDIETLMPVTFCIIVQQWYSFSSDTQQSAHDVVEFLLKGYSNIVRTSVIKLPSLAPINLLAKFDAELSRLKEHLEPAVIYEAFSHRCSDENEAVAIQGLRELEPYLEKHQHFIHEAAVSENPSPVVLRLTRSLLDACTRFNKSQPDASSLCAKCLGIIGCMDPNRVETVREKREILVLSNFERPDEAVDFVAFFLEHIIVKAFHSTSTARLQAFLAYAMQEMLKFCGFTEELTHRPRSSQADYKFQRWFEMPELVRSTLTPFLNSKYILRSKICGPPERSDPVFHTARSHGTWIREFVLDLLFKANGENARVLFSVFARIVRNHDDSIANFLLPFAVANVIIGGTVDQTKAVVRELRAVLDHDTTALEEVEAKKTTQCSENVFQVLDYLSRWVKERRRTLANSRNIALRAGRVQSDFDEETATAQINSVEAVLSSFTPKTISHRAIECGLYTRALLYWEQYIRETLRKPSGDHSPAERDLLYQRLQDIYAQIDEPDSLEGISAHMQILSPDQQLLEHKRAGRWTAAQTWYELSLSKDPDNMDMKVELLRCLKESGQHEAMLKYVRCFHEEKCEPLKILPYAAEASWMTSNWRTLQEYFEVPLHPVSFNIGIGKAFLAVLKGNFEQFRVMLDKLRESVVKDLSAPATASIQTCHDHLLKLHALYEVERVVSPSDSTFSDLANFQEVFNRRLDVLGAFTADKQYVLGLRRASLELSNRSATSRFTNLDIARAWLTSARLARKSNLTNVAFDAVLQASGLGDEASKLEHSRLLWKDGHHRKAIQTLQGAIAANVFNIANLDGVDSTTRPSEDQRPQSLFSARAHLLLAKWLDQSGHTQTSTILEKYQFAVRSYSRWDKGQYYLGRYYNKLLEAQKALPPGKQSQSFMLGENVKLVVDSYLRSLAFGAKYLFQALPKVLTLWLDFGADIPEPVSHLYADEFRKSIVEQRPKYLDSIHKQLKKYFGERIPAWMLYTALAQAVSRICHPNPKVYEVLSMMITRVVASHPQQALWSLLPVVKSSSPDRASRGFALLGKLKEQAKKMRTESAALELRGLINQGQKLSEQLLHACEASVDGRSSTASLSKDLGFNHKIAPCALVVPLESTLTASLPTISDMSPKAHKALPRDTITISSFFDEVLVLSSLQRPRKLTVRGSDGNSYGLLCKPKDDLRKDQRLMEFNAMINRALKRDTESSKRRLYIKTYAVTPLNEECGAIEWVDNLKPMRDILIKIYKQKGTHIDYNHIRELLVEACAAPPDTIPIFTTKILPQFPPVLHEWFTETFPAPDAWFAARLRYTRSCAVTSMVGHVLGLGDRHGENILLEETSGGVFHVDFNCLFDKGLTFERPEMVPFRLTHNMVDAFGPQGVEGAFRRSAELAVGIVRRSEDALLCVLETFVWDPTQDFVGRRKRSVKGVPETPREVLESVAAKVRGLLSGESVPLSVEGFVDALIRQATSPANLAAMYIGWCAFF